MHCILRRHELQAGARADAAHAAEEALILPLAELRADSDRWRGQRSRFGVRLAPGDAVEELAGLLPFLAVIAVEFPNASEGRGYSQARLLRERLGFVGELRAVGPAVRQDQLFLMARCGFDAFELAPGEDLDSARRALTRYDVAYQPGSTLLGVRQRGAA
jgi:uncharacterized protein (DUF934 family)